MAIDRESMRWRGQKLEELHPRVRDDVVKQLDAADAANEQRSEVRKILDEYPRYDPVQLRAAIRQMRETIGNFKDKIRDEEKAIAEYEELIVQCTERDAKLVSIGERGLHEK